MPRPGSIIWSRHPDAVKEAPVQVTAQEVAAIPTDAAAPDAKASDPLAREKAWYQGFVSRYFRLYFHEYERFRQASDAQLTRDQFDNRFVGTGQRVEAIGSGDLSSAGDKARLERLLGTMTEVAALPDTVNRLGRYRRAARTSVSRVIRGVRTERYCSYYGYYINMCLTYGRREVPFSRTATEMRLPASVLEPAVLFGRQQERFLKLLSTRTEQGQSAANAERDRLAAGNVTGAQRLWAAVTVMGSFLLLMFLFLLIAIERHQRRIWRHCPPRDRKASRGRRRDQWCPPPARDVA